MSNSSVWHIDRDLSGTTTPGHIEPVSNSNEEVHILHSTRTRASLLDCLVLYIKTLIGWGLFTLLRYSLCILQHQPTGPQDTTRGSFTPLQRCSLFILQHQLTGPQDTPYGSLQRCSLCILQPQLTGQNKKRRL